MTKLSEQLADLSARAASVENRVEALKSETLEKRDAKVAELKTGVETARSTFENSVKSKGDAITNAWADLTAGMKARAEAVKSSVLAKKDAVEAGHARLRADILEEDAASAIAFAILAMDDAERAAAEAMDARLIADSFD